MQDNQSVLDQVKAIDKLFDFVRQFDDSNVERNGIKIRIEDGGYTKVVVSEQVIVYCTWTYNGNKLCYSKGDSDKLMELSHTVDRPKTYTLGQLLTQSR